MIWEGNMKLPRRNFLQLAASATALPAVSHFAWAQAYPSRPVRIVVGDAAGGAPDTVARLIGQLLAERLGQPFVIENRPGAGTNIATESVVRAPPDGYTLLVVSNSAASSASLYEKLNFNIVSDIAPVAGIARAPLVMVVNPSFPAKTVQEFVAYARTHPAAINMASAGIGTGPHMAGELFKVLFGINMVHVPFRGGPPALTAILGGQAHVYFIATSSSIELIRAGKLRPLGVTTVKRWELLPDVPAIGEFAPDYEASIWFGVGAPKNTPAEIVDKLNKEIGAGLADPKIKLRLADLGNTGLSLLPGEFGKLIANETARWGKVIRAANIKLE
jgi:tripartite-type tricarboxylate transporter receptor subunit TctC